MYTLFFIVAVILGFFTLGPFGALIGAALVYVVRQSSKNNTARPSKK